MPPKMLTNYDIEKAKQKCHYSLPNPAHYHDDCIRIAYEWLDAQKPIKNPQLKVLDLKHIIENWAGRYVSRSDVEVAATLHPKFFGRYPCYNLSSKLVRPSTARLKHITEAFTHKQYLKNADLYPYHTTEKLPAEE